MVGLVTAECEIPHSFPESLPRRNRMWTLLCVVRSRATELFAEALPGLDGAKAEQKKWRYVEEPS